MEYFDDALEEISQLRNNFLKQREETEREPDQRDIFDTLIKNIKWYEAKAGYKEANFESRKRYHAWQTLDPNLEFYSLGRFIKEFVTTNDLNIDLTHCAMRFIPNFWRDMYDDEEGENYNQNWDNEEVEISEDEFHDTYDDFNNHHLQSTHTLQ